MKQKRITAMLTAAACGAVMLGAMPANSVQAVALVENGFEVNYDGWYGDSANDTVTLIAEAGKGYQGTRGMRVSGRTAASEGASSRKGFYLGGDEQYDYSVRVYSETDETFRLTLSLVDEDTEEVTVKELAVKAVRAGEWTELSAAYKAPKKSCDFKLTITTDSTNDFFFDDVTVTAQRQKTAYAADLGLKDEFAAYFRVGNILNWSTVNNAGIKQILLKDCNAIECENETKPDATLVANGSTNTDIKVKLDSCAAIADFCVQNNLAFRGHTMVWHSQTPEWFFKENMAGNSGNYVSSSVMDQRLESYIKNMFNAFATQYPSLNLYAYDICNECVSDDANRTANYGGAREPGYGNGASPWVSVYGSNIFVEKAFTYARQYAPSTCKLYYNDYNEYWDHKRDCIYNMCKSLYEKGVLDGVGMQSHIDAGVNSFSGTQSYITAMQKYLSIGCDVQITELDISVKDGYSSTDQANKYTAIFNAAKEWNESHPRPAGRVTLVQIWGPNDANSWLSAGSNALLYDSNNQPKEAYTALTQMIPQSEWGDGSNYTDDGTPSVLEPDADGYWFHYTFENGTESFTGRGSASVATANSAYAGSQSLAVTGREASWNGASHTLSARPFTPGEAFSFSANIMYNDGPASDTFHFTLQYDGADGETHYVKIATETAVKGEWVQLANTSFTIPEGASNMQIYFETEDSTTSFYVDEVIGAPEGTEIVGAGPGKVPVLRGDVDLNGAVNLADAVALQGYLTGSGKVEIGAEQADLNDDKKLTAVDLTLLKRLLMNNETSSPDTGSTGNTSDPTAYMESVRQAMTLNVPSSATTKGASDYGTVEHISYYSKTAAKNKGANVLLPAGYSANQSYPVLYVNHGIFGDESSMLDESMKIQTMAGNLAASGEAVPMIIVFTSMYTSAASDQCSGFTQAEMRAYDAFLYDIEDSLMPYINEHYSTKTGRDNTAIAGFSMGGRETLYIGVSRPDLFGYIGAACPAPGIVAAVDQFMTHEGSMKESEFKISGSNLPYVLMIAGGTNDTVVGTFPEQYHNLLTQNGTDHIWQSVPGGGHDASVVVPLMYNFLRSVFQA